MGKNKMLIYSVSVTLSMNLLDKLSLSSTDLMM